MSWRNEITNSEKYINSRDVVKRVDELKDEMTEAYDAHAEGLSVDDTPTFDEWVQEVSIDSAHLLEDEATEYQHLAAFLDEIDHPEDGHNLIRDDEFENYTRQFADDMGAVDEKNSSWVVIDWAATADNLKPDFTTADLDGTTYYYRA